MPAAWAALCSWPGWLAAHASTKWLPLLWHQVDLFLRSDSQCRSLPVQACSLKPVACLQRIVSSVSIPCLYFDAYWLLTAAADLLSLCHVLSGLDNGGRSCCVEDLGSTNKVALSVLSSPSLANVTCKHLPGCTIPELHSCPADSAAGPAGECAECGGTHACQCGVWVSAGDRWRSCHRLLQLPGRCDHGRKTSRAWLICQQP